MGQISGPHRNRNRPGLTFRGSRRRLRQLRFRDNWSREMWFLVVVMGLALLVLVPWLIIHQ
jgi:hypothetical protein